MVDDSEPRDSTSQSYSTAMPLLSVIFPPAALFAHHGMKRVSLMALSDLLPQLLAKCEAPLDSQVYLTCMMCKAQAAVTDYRS